MQQMPAHAGAPAASAAEAGRQALLLSAALDWAAPSMALAYQPLQRSGSDWWLQAGYWCALQLLDELGGSGVLAHASGSALQEPAWQKEGLISCAWQLTLGIQLQAKP